MQRPRHDVRSIDPAERCPSTDHLDGLLARLAGAQGGAVERQQLLAHGIAKGGIHRRQAVLEAAGYAVLRVRRSDPPHQILQRIRQALAARSVDGAR